MRYFIGPMSKNVVDAVLEFNYEFGDIFGLLPSRRQVEYNGGYVNDWNTEEFHSYVRYASFDMTTLIERDHSGAGQGYEYDDGYESLKEDCKFVDLIHIDPWKNHQGYSDGIRDYWNRQIPEEHFRQTMKIINEIPRIASWWWMLDICAWNVPALQHSSETGMVELHFQHGRNSSLASFLSS